ncbi:ABC transporter ATP-binding protein [Glaciihabitans sp. UYNi722]|uniref:sulfate/molybdate ABC transporter ATP-binding protein n=1 Tax=Glaciihabitans sp. UYNi722 TaxID=3156344 RepID=UPI00339895BB
MTLTVEARVAERGFDLALGVGQGETVAILGPNGAGKSTLLAIIAGLLRPDVGRAEWAGTPLFDVGGSRNTWLPPHQRGVSLLAQEPLLFPHLSALDNVAFGPRSAGRSRDASRAVARGWLVEVEASDLERAKPGKLSGGQAQRVAVARALASDPKLLLLDEPLAALDVTVASTLRRMLRRVLADRTAIVVTHEVLDALTFADRVVVMNGGAIIEHGPTRTVLEQPRHPFTAQLAGLNLVTGRSTATGLVTDDGLPISGESIGVGVRAAAAIRPSAIAVHRDRPVADTVVRVVVSDLEPRGDFVRVRAGALSADIAPGRAAALDLAPGVGLYFSFAASEVSIYAL